MDIELDLEEDKYYLTPFDMLMDYSDSYIKEHEHESIGANFEGFVNSCLYGYNFTKLLGVGNLVNLREAFREKFTELRTAGLDYDSTQTPHTMCELELEDLSGNETTYNYSYGLIYNHQYRNQLIVRLFGMVFDPDFIGGGSGTQYGYLDITIDYDKSQTIRENLIAYTIRHLNTPAAANARLEGSITIVIGTFNGICKPIREMGFDPISTESGLRYYLKFLYATLDMYDDIPEGLLDPPPQSILHTFYYGYCPIYTIPFADLNAEIGDVVDPTAFPAAPSGSLYLNNLYGIKINGVDYEASNTSDSQSRTTPEHDWNSKTFYETSDYIPSDGVPINDALDTGFIHAYLMTPTNARALANYMLTDDFIEGVKHLFADPIDYILSFSMIPVQPTTGGSAHILIGGVDTEISADVIAEQFKEFKCGKCKCDELWNGFVDYNTKVSIFLPFVGIKYLNVDDVMTGELEVIYRVDVLTGEFIVTVNSNTKRDLNGIIAAYNGCMGMDVPINAVSYQNKIQALTSAVSGGIGFAAGVASGNALGAVSGAGSAAAGVAEAVLMKPTIERSGSLSGSSGVLGNYTPYLIIERPVQALPKNYKDLNGYASRIGGKVSDFSGYLELDEIDLSGIACTEAEKDLILQAFKEGCFV